MVQPRAYNGGLVRCGNLFKSEGVVYSNLGRVNPNEIDVLPHGVHTEFPVIYSLDLDDKGPEENPVFKDENGVPSGGMRNFDVASGSEGQLARGDSISSLKEHPRRQ